MHKYFTWTDDEGYFRGQQLLHKSQISTLLKHRALKEECFATIQDYDAEGNCIGCPLYFDIDSLSLYDAHQDMLTLVSEIRDVLDVEPMVWFSGSKGFHVVCPLYIRHERCHEIAKMVALELSDCMDMSVYRSRSMWRCEATYNDKGKGFKVRVNIDTELSKMVDASNFNEGSTNIVSDIKDLDIVEYVEKLPSFKERMQEIGDDFSKDFKPCMQRLWEMDSPPEGQRHHFCHIMARHCYRSGLSLKEAESLFGNHPFWSKVKARDYEKVIQSVYRGGRCLIGCKSGTDADVLRPYCSVVCNLNNSMSITDFIGGNNV